MDMVLVHKLENQEPIVPLCMINVDRIQQVTIVPESAEGSTSSYRFRSERFRSDQFCVEVRISSDSDNGKYEGVSFYTGRLANCLEVASYYYAKNWGRLNQIAALGLLESVFDSALSLRTARYDYPRLEAIKYEVLRAHKTVFSSYTADVDFTEVVSEIQKGINTLECKIKKWESAEPPTAAEFINPHRHVIRLLKIALRFLQ